MKRNIEEIVEVRKFNPFHDHLGRFASAQGFKTYSANPRTKAGQMAIARSAEAGHGATFNAHRESKGENISQNYSWINGKPVKAPAGATGAPTAKPKASTKPNTLPKAKTPPKAKIKPQSASDPVKGKDISRTFKLDRNRNPQTGKMEPAVDQVAKKQGFLGKPKVVSQKEFDDAVKTSGVVGFRTINGGTNVLTGKKSTGQDFADILMRGDAKDFSLNGSGAQMYGGGLYVATSRNPKPGRVPSGEDRQQARADSEMYGNSTSAVVTMTLSPTAKVGDYTKVTNEFASQPDRIRHQFNNDVGAYAAAKGYDALKSVDAGWDCDYTVVYNRTALIISKTVEEPGWALY